MSENNKNKDKETKKADTGPATLDTLALANMPLTSNTLKGARLIKNSRMETTIELYNDPIAGSLQILPEDIAESLTATEEDQLIVNQLAGLHSYDVYSLRGSLKKLGIEVSDAEYLVLSDSVKDSLGKYTLEFTRPLVEKIYGAGQLDVDTTHGLQKIFRDPDIKRVRDNLKTMAAKTGIPLDEIPKFLEDYSDVFLSVAYYRNSFESVGPDIERFMVWSQQLKTHRDVASTPQTLASCKKAEDTLRFLSGSVNERLEKFRGNFEMFWQDINRKSFSQLRTQIEENHSSMGSVLCGLVVKMRYWAREFPDNAVGGPTTRAKFVITELEPGLLKLKNMEIEVRQRLGMPNIKI